MERDDYHHGDLRRALIQAAGDLLDARKTPSLRAVARAAGVSQAAPYRHFADKEALLAAVAQEGFAALAQAMGAVDADQPEQRIQRMGVAYVTFAVSHPGWFRVMFGDAVDQARHPDCAAAAHAAFALLSDGVEAALAAGRLQGAAHDLTLVAWSLVHGLASLMVEGQGRAAGLDPEQAEAVAARVTLAALSAMGG